MKTSRLRIIVVVTIVFSSTLLFLPSIPLSFEHALVFTSNPKASESLPSPPEKVDVHFSDPVDIHYSTIKVLDSSGKEVDKKDTHYSSSDQTNLSVSLPAGLPNGIYTVSTKVLDQTDGHVTENGFVFAVGVSVPKSTGKPQVTYSDVISIPDAIARFPALAGQVIVVGAAFSTLWLWRPVSKIEGFQKRVLEVRNKIDSRASVLILIGAIIVFVSGFGMIAAVSYSIHAGFAQAVATKFGQMWIIRMITASVLLGLVTAFYFKQKKSQSSFPKWQTATILGVGIAVLSTTSLISHGAATGKAAPLILDFVHNLVASVWVGGILYFDLIVIPKLRQVSVGNIPSAIMSLVIPEFSSVVLLILGTITITGPLLLFFLETNLAIVLASIYGKVLLIKLSLAAAMIAIGAYHQIFIHRRAFRAIKISQNGTIFNDMSEHVRVLSRFRISAKAEAILGIALIASIAALVDSGLPATEFQGLLQAQQPTDVFATSSSTTPQSEFTQTAFIDNGSRIVLSIDPFFTGANDIKVSFIDAKRNPIDIKSVQMELTQTDQSVGPIAVTTDQSSQGTYSAHSNALALPGHWHLHVEGVPAATNSLTLVSDFNFNLKPKASTLAAKINEYKIDNNTLPLYPTFDKSRNAVWSGDTQLKSGQIIEFDLGSKKYIKHKIDGTNIITFTALDPQNDIWYVDPISKILGYFNPSDNTHKNYDIPTKGSISGLALDNAGNVWLTSSSANTLIKFNPQKGNFSTTNLPDGSIPLGLAIDKSDNNMWIAESGTGKLANVDPSKGYKISEYAPSQNHTLASPTALLIDPVTGRIFVSEHDGGAVSEFDPILKTFTQYKLDAQGLPFGMAFDHYHNLWVAQHTLNKIVVLDPRTGEKNEFDIPSPSSFTQYVTSDDKGNIIMAEQRANAISTITTTINATLSQTTGQPEEKPTLPKLGISYGQLAAPVMAAALIGVAFVYSRNAIDIKNNIKHLQEKYS